MKCILINTLMNYIFVAGKMDILKFIKSFHTVNTYLMAAIFLLITMIIYFYHINPTA
jgi:hypothetical protein